MKDFDTFLIEMMVDLSLTMIILVFVFLLGFFISESGRRAPPEAQAAAAIIDSITT